MKIKKLFLENARAFYSPKSKQRRQKKMDDKSQNPQTQVVYVKNGDNESKPMTVGSWIVTFILLAIPVANIICIFVWCCGGVSNPPHGRRLHL